MSKHVAFLRGMNVGGNRITNDELCGHFETLGFGDAAAFLASGNVVFTSEDPPQTANIESALLDALGYAVPVFLRTADEVAEIAELDLFAGDIEDSVGAPQIAFLNGLPDESVLDLVTVDDLLQLGQRELYWLPKLGFSNSELDLKEIESILGAMTIRTKRTIDRIAAKFLQP